jgi:putative DNA primase/helicase
MKNSHVVFNPKDLSNSPFSRKDYSRPEYLATRKASEIGIKATTWAIPDFFPQGELTVLARPKATGKSTIYCAISAAVSRGHIYPSWPGKLNQDPDGVLIISSEDDVERTIVPRLIAADADLNRIQIIDGVRKYSRETRAYTFDEADNERIVNTVDHMGGVGLIC